MILRLSQFFKRNSFANPRLFLARLAPHPPSPSPREFGPAQLVASMLTRPNSQGEGELRLEDCILGGEPAVLQYALVESHRGLRV